MFTEMKAFKDLPGLGVVPSISRWRHGSLLWWNGLSRWQQLNIHQQSMKPSFFEHTSPERPWNHFCCEDVLVVFTSSCRLTTLRHVQANEMPEQHCWRSCSIASVRLCPVCRFEELKSSEHKSWVSGKIVHSLKYKSLEFCDIWYCVDIMLILIVQVSLCSLQLYQLSTRLVQGMQPFSFQPWSKFASKKLVARQKLELNRWLRWTFSSWSAIDICIPGEDASERILAAISCG